MSGTPSIVRAAFCPATRLELTLEGLLVLEAIGCQLITGGRAGVRDAALAWLAMTDLPALKAARRDAALDAHVEAWAAGVRPGDFLAAQHLIGEAVEAAMAPAPPSPDTGAGDPLDALAAEKKSAPTADGG